MNKSNLFIFAVLFIVAGQAAGNAWYWPPSYTEIVPEHPTSCDVVAITLGGEWPDSCIPNYSAVSVVGNNIYFDVILGYPPGIVCALVITPWELTESVGPLPTGAYTIHVCLIGDPFVPPGYITVAGFIVTAESCTYYVNAADGNDLNDGLTSETAFATIQKGVDTTDSGDTVIVLPGVYTGPGNRDIDFGGRAITLRSNNGPENCIIDCQGSEFAIHRGFYFHNAEDSNSVADGFTIRNGYVYDYGGGIYCSGASPIIINCAITNNKAVGIPGWDWGMPGEDAYGGAIFCTTNSHLTIKNCIIADNECRGGDGGPGGVGIPGAGGSAYGGAIYGGNLTIQNCVIAHNTALPGDGEGMVVPSPVGSGAVCHIVDSTVSITNSIIWDNQLFEPYFGPQIVLDSQDSPSVMAISDSDIQDGQAQVETCTGCLLIWANNIDVNPRFANAANGDYHLQSQAGRWDPNTNSWVIDTYTSPCIDTGSITSDWTAELWPHGKCINMGTYGGTPQASMSLSDVGNIADLNNDNRVDYNDVNIFTDKWPNHQFLIPEDLDRNGLIDFVDFAIFAENWP